MKILLLLPLLLGFSVPAIAHNDANGGCDTHCFDPNIPPMPMPKPPMDEEGEGEEGEGADVDKGWQRYGYE